MATTAEMGFETDAMLNGVSPVTGRPDWMSAMPNPTASRISPRCTTATASPGMPASVRNESNRTLKVPKSGGGGG